MTRTVKFNEGGYKPRAGDLVINQQGEQLLLGDLNVEGGSCDDCPGIYPGDEITLLGNIYDHPSILIGEKCPWCGSSQNELRRDLPRPQRECLRCGALGPKESHATRDQWSWKVQALAKDQTVGEGPSLGALPFKCFLEPNRELYAYFASSPSFGIVSVSGTPIATIVKIDAASNTLTVEPLI